MQRNLLHVLFLVFLFIGKVWTQNSAIIRGYVLDGASGEPISFANVLLVNEEKGVSSDVEGFFSLGGLSEGRKTIMITYLGYDSLVTEIDLKAGEVYFSNFMLEESGILLNEVGISAAKIQSRTEVKVSQISITPKEINQLPSIGGESDVVQYLQVIPGIITTGDQGGQLYIRGGSPIQNKILLDGLTIYNPFHSIGFYSVFETDIIRGIDVYTGGFPAEHGGRISAIVDIKTREGDKKNFGGQVAINPFLAKAYLEGPLVKLTENGGSTSFILSSKNSIIQNSANIFYPGISLNDSIGLPFKFNDHYGKISFVNQNGSRLNLFGFNYNDGYNNPALANLNWINNGGGADFRLLPGNSNFILNGMVGYSDYRVSMEEASGGPRTSRINGFTARVDFSFFGDNNEVNYGIEFNSFRTSFRFQNPFRILISQNQNTTEIGGYFKYRHVINRLILEPSVRIQYYASLNEFSPEPRLGVKYNLTDYLRLKLALGRYSQNLLSASNERDVVNLFTGFLSGPEERIFKLGSTEAAQRNTQISNHAVGGLEYDLTGSLSLNLEGYYKDFPQLIIVNRNKVTGSDPNFSTEEGYAYGFDISSNYKGNKVDVTLNYALGYVRRFDGEQLYPTLFDRRHNINALAIYSFGKDDSWSASARWNFGSGFPFTRTQGFYNNNPFTEGLGSDYLQYNPEVIGIIYEEDRNAGRLPYYHRLDISLDKKLIVNKFIDLDVNASVTNVYNRKNIFYFDRLSYERVDQLPVLASIGLKANFN